MIAYSVIVPAYNEEKLIGKVIDTMPDYVDKIVIVDDKSSDGTVEIELAGLVDHTHPAPAEQVLDLVVSQCAPGELFDIHRHLL